MGGRVFFYFIKKDMSDADTVQRGRDIRVGAVGNGGMPAGYDQGLFTELYKVPGVVISGLLYCNISDSDL